MDDTQFFLRKYLSHAQYFLFTVLRHFHLSYLLNCNADVIVKTVASSILQEVFCELTAVDRRFNVIPVVV